MPSERVQRQIDRLLDLAELLLDGNADEQAEAQRHLEFAIGALREMEPVLSLPAGRQACRRNAALAGAGAEAQRAAEDVVRQSILNLGWAPLWDFDHSVYASQR